MKNIASAERVDKVFTKAGLAGALNVRAPSIKLIMEFDQKHKKEVEKLVWKCSKCHASHKS